MLLLRLARNASVLGVVQRRPPVSLRRRALSVRGASLPAADDGSYNTLASRVMVETEVKKSKFIAIAVPITSADAAMEFVAAERDPSARHNCFAYKIGTEYRFSDDGEPGGTAGRPILSAIEGSGLDAVAVLVIRWFGGIKLGAGGLVRAYSGAAAAALRDAPTRRVAPRRSASLRAEYRQLGTVYKILDAHQAVRTGEEFLEDGSVRIEVDVEASLADGLDAALREATAGAVGLGAALAPAAASSP